jgi:hypothetical protein
MIEINNWKEYLYTKLVLWIILVYILSLNLAQAFL